MTSSKFDSTSWDVSSSFWLIGISEVWYKELSGGSKAVLLLNRSEKESQISVDFSLIKVTTKCKMRDLWEHKDLGMFEKQFSAKVESHGVVVVKCSLSS